MSYNGSGTFVVNSSGQPVVTGTVISSTAFNALTADLATGLSTAITKDGQTTTTARILFAQGVSSTLTTDATSATTGSIITAGGISMQKALWVGTTSRHVGATQFDAAITYGGVTLSNAVTGTGNMVLSASPTLTGTLTAAAANFSGTVTATQGGANLLSVVNSASTADARIRLQNTGGSTDLGVDATGPYWQASTFSYVRTISPLTVLAALTYGGVTLSNSVTGTGNMVLSTSPTIQEQTATSPSANNCVILSRTGSSSGTGRIYANSGDMFGVNDGTLYPFTVAQGASSSTLIVGTASVTVGKPLTYGGVTLSNSVTGTGSMVLSDSPTLAFNSTTTWTSNGSPLIIGNSSNNNYVQVTRTGGNASSLRVGANTDQAILSYTGSSGFAILYNATTTAVTFSTAGAVRFNTGYGVGTITSDASGNLTSVSDPAEKDFVAAFKPALPEIMAIARNEKYMGQHRWRKDNVSGQETEGVYASFFAHDDFPITDAVHKGKNGINSFSDRPIIMALVNAVAELKAEIETLKGTH